MSCNIFVSGLITIESTLRVENFPVNYTPVNYPFFGTGVTVSGVGYNIAKALKTLGNTVSLLSITGKDLLSELVNIELEKNGLDTKYIYNGIDETSTSIILYDKEGKRSIYCDLKDLQETRCPEIIFKKALGNAKVAVMCTVNYNREYLDLIKNAGLIIATDIHCISDLYDPYNSDFMKAADILFMSDEHLPCSPEKWVEQLSSIYNNKIIVIGLGAKGAMLFVRKDNKMISYPAKTVRPVVNTIGAGDALFSAFLSEYTKDSDPYEAIEKAIIFAGYKIGEKGTADGFIDSYKLEELYRNSKY